MNFANPEAFWLLALLPIYFALHRKRGQAKRPLPLPTFQFLFEIRQKFIWQSFVPGLFYLLGFLFLLAALARPQFGQEIITKKQEGIDIILALDVSGSMQAEDFAPNRLEAAKKVISKFIQSQKSNRIGIVVFAGKSFTLLPLTTDYQLAIDAVKDVSFEMLKKSGTNIKDAIVNGSYRFKDDNKKSRVIILLTDGVDNNPVRYGYDGKPLKPLPPIAAAIFAEELEIKIHTIGVGNPESTPVITSDPRTGKKQYARDRYGNLIYTQYDEPTLQEIARLTGGLYFNAYNENKLDEVYKEISQMEKAKFKIKKSTIYLEQMHFFLWPAFFFFLLAYILNHTLARIIRI